MLCTHHRSLIKNKLNTLFTNTMSRRAWRLEFAPKSMGKPGHASSETMTHSLNEALDAPNQTRRPFSHSRQRHCKHRDEAQRDVDRNLCQAPYPEAVQQQPLLSPADQPLYA